MACGSKATLDLDQQRAGQNAPDLLIEVKSACGEWDYAVFVMGVKTAALHMRPMSILSIFTALVALLALTAQLAIAQTTLSERGQAIAEKHCARCHAIGPAGNSPMGLAPPFRDLSQRYPIETLAEALAEGIMTGHPAMPNFTFHPREIDALLTYIDGLTPLREPRTRKH